MEKLPRVGVGVYILKDGKVLLGKRKNSHGEGSWCPPGGHLEFGEEVGGCARREVFEETGIKIKNIRTGPYTNDFFKEDKQYITLSMIADYDSGDAKVLEPHKCEKWGWFFWEELPTPLFLSVENAIKKGFDPAKY